MTTTKETVLEIDLKALKHNFEFLKSKINPNTKFLAVVKAFAYGSDAAIVANYLQELESLLNHEKVVAQLFGVRHPKEQSGGFH